MDKYLPVLIVGAIIGIFTIAFLIAYTKVQRDKTMQEFQRKMPDSMIIKRLLGYGRPYLAQFILVLVIMLISIVYDLVSPILVGNIQNLIKNDFPLNKLFLMVGAYAAILVISMISMYLQTMILQKVGQKILSDLREDVFSHIESLSHEQLNNIPVGKLVTRVTNDTDGICRMFTNVLVTMVKNVMVIVGVLASMLFVNYAMTLVVLCFVPFVAIFTYIFQKFSRKAHRAVTDSRTELNTFLSENLSGIKITQIFNREDEKMAAFEERSFHIILVTEMIACRFHSDGDDLWLVASENGAVAVFGFCVVDESINHVHAFEYLTEDGVLEVQHWVAAEFAVAFDNFFGPAVFCTHGCHLIQQIVRNIDAVYNVELAALGVHSLCSCHADCAAEVAEVLTEFYFKAFTPDGFATGAVAFRVTALDHEVLDDAVEGQTVVVTIFRMSQEVFYCFWSVFRIEAHFDGAGFGFNDSNLSIFCRFVSQLWINSGLSAYTFAWGFRWGFLCILLTSSQGQSHHAC